MYKKIKNILDKLFSILAIIILLPLLLFIALLIKLDSKGTIILKQQRVGYQQSIFYIYKFRTMTKTDISFDPNNPIVDSTDYRVTRVGKILRKFKLDELPQLLNIFKGEMSFIGVRPLLPSYLRVYEDWEYKKFNVKPGLSGLAQINGNSYLSTSERSYYDILYGKKLSLYLDVKILFITGLLLIFGEKKFVKNVSASKIEKLINQSNWDTNNKIKIAQIVGNVTLGGVPNVVLNYCKYINTDKFAIDFYTFGESKINDKFKEIGRVFTLPSFKNFPLAMFKFNSFLKENHYSIIHSHLTTLSFFPLLVAWIRNVQVRICHAHSTTNIKDSKRLLKLILRPLCKTVATKYVACSKFVAGWFYGQSNTALILQNAINLNKFELNLFVRNELIEKFNLTSKTLGFVGRFGYQKNIEFMLDILYELNTIDEWQLILVGDGEEKLSILAKIEQLNLQDKVVIIPPTDEICKYYNIFDIFVMTSIFEGLPLVAIEGLANGLPLVLSDTISDELATFDGVSYISLEKSPTFWAKYISSLNLNRNNNIPALTNSGFDIHDEFKKLETLYLSCYKEINK